MNYRITIKKLATGEHKTIHKTLTDKEYENCYMRMNKAENGYVITRIEITLDNVRNYVEKNP
jgi:hypothetical protein